MTPQAARARAREDDRQQHPVALGAPQVHVAAAQVLRLQRSAGNAAVGRALTRSPGRVVWRLRLSASQVLSKVETIDFMKAKLGASLRGEAMHDQVQRTLTKYEAMHGAKHGGGTSTGVMLAMTLEGVARMIAEELFDPAIQGQLATKLLELYETEIKAATGLGKDKHGAESLALAKVLVADDPVALYMHKEMRLEVAVARIRKMATDTRRTPERMFDLLRHKWEAQMAAQDRQKVAAAHPTSGAYNIKEATGEISDAYLTKLFGTDKAAPLKADGKGLAFAAPQQQRLDDLRAKVVKPDDAVDMSTFQPRHAGMTAKQERHLQELEGRETDQLKGDARAQLAAKVSEALAIPSTSTQATDIVKDIETWLTTVPLTITVWGKRWFDAGVPGTGQTAFRPATKAQTPAKVATIFNKPAAAGDIEHTPKYDDPVYGKERGEKYLRFRTWKDRLMTSNLDFDPAELPVFGAANVNWDRNRGTVEGAIKDGVTVGAGENYYGDTHFHLRDAIRNRVIYTATDHGPPRRDPLLAVLDFVTPGGGLTGLGSVKPVMLLQVIDAAKTKKSNIRADLPFEIQIFGGVDIATDVQAIHYAPGLPANIKQNIVQFCKTNGLAAEQIAPTDRSTLVDGNVTGIKKVRQEIGKELHKGAIDDELLAGKRDGDQQIIVRAIAALRFQVSNDHDFGVLKKELLEIDLERFALPPGLLVRFQALKEYVDAYKPASG